MSVVSSFNAFVQRFSNEGGGGSGYITVEDFTQLITSRDLGFQLTDNELVYIMSQVQVYTLILYS